MLDSIRIDSIEVLFRRRSRSGLINVDPYLDLNSIEFPSRILSESDSISWIALTDF